MQRSNPEKNRLIDFGIFGSCGIWKRSKIFRCNPNECSEWAQRLYSSSSRYALCLQRADYATAIGFNNNNMTVNWHIFPIRCGFFFFLFVHLILLFTFCSIVGTDENTALRRSSYKQLLSIFTFVGERRVYRVQNNSTCAFSNEWLSYYSKMKWYCLHAAAKTQLIHDCLQNIRE